jgi:hypothetical protein
VQEIGSISRQPLVKVNLTPFKKRTPPMDIGGVHG